MTLSWLWLAVVFVVRALFRRNPVSFGRRCCELALGVVSAGLPADAKDDWLDEAMDHAEQEIWHGRKRLPDDHIGARLVWQAVTIIIHGWADRQHYRQVAAAHSQSAGADLHERIRFPVITLLGPLVRRMIEDPLVRRVIWVGLLVNSIGLLAALSPLPDLPLLISISIVLSVAALTCASMFRSAFRGRRESAAEPADSRWRR